ncbi:class I SAM-dependent methyltransferase [Rubrobacter radiotolerans]|uniref:class I SAM-dependent methyltransferase n=1 Tax=Rubrobacter radiotolerans TaxID=42256 RepID=UPI0039F024D0
MARRLAGLDLAGKTGVELGCGIGLPSAVAARRGASVTLTDHYAPALDFAAHNVLENSGVEAETRLLDWHRPGEGLEGLGPFDLVLAADVLYERRNVAPLADLVPKLLAEGGEALFADPRRAGGELFLREMERRGFSVRSEAAVVVEDGRPVNVAVHSLRRG